MRKKIKNVLIGISVGILMCSGLASCSSDDSSSGDGEKVIIGLDVEYPPIGYENEDGTITGFDVELAKLALEGAGFEIEFQPINWDSKEEEINTGKIDLIWNGMNYTAERGEAFETSEIYFQNDIILIVKGDSNITSFADLAGLNVASQKGSGGTDALNAAIAAGTFPEVNLVEVDSMVKGLEEVEQGLSVAFVADGVQLFDIKESGKDLKALDESLTPGGFIVAAKKGNTELIAKVNEALQRVYDDGSSIALSNTWFGEDLMAPIPNDLKAEIS